MKILDATPIRVAAAVFAITAGLSLMPRTAGALTIGHTGSGVGGVVTAASQEVDVQLLDLLAVQDPGDLAGQCDIVGTDACLGKVWMAGSQNDIHFMAVMPDGPEFRMIEFVANATGVPWTDYHLHILNAEIAHVEAAFFLLDPDNEILFVIDAGITTEVMDDTLWFFFDQPVPSAEFPPDEDDGSLLFGFLIDFEEAADTVLIGQHPSTAVPAPGTLAVFGLGLAGIGWLRRRKQA